MSESSSDPEPGAAESTQSVAELRKEMLTLIGQQAMLSLKLHSTVRYLAQGYPIDAEMLADLRFEHDVLMKLVDNAMVRFPEEGSE